MNTWIRKVGMGAIALTLAGVLGGCNNGNGSSSILLFFGISGTGDCNSVVVTVELEDASAVVTLDAAGDPLCVLSSELQDQNCSIDPRIASNGDLVVAIDDCDDPISASGNLFSCEFEEVDLSNVRENTSAQCDCVNDQNCVGNPPICISDSEDFRSCEDCNNNIDDDDNGQTDCADDKCSNDPACNGGTTTSTTSTSITVSTSSTTNTTTTTSSTMTTTTVEAALTCNLFLHLDDPVTLSSLAFDVDYSDAPGSFPGSAGTVQCSSLLPASALVQFNDIEAEEILRGGIISTAGFSGPANIAQCTFLASTQPNPNNFTVTVTEASDNSAEPQPVEPPPVVSVVGPITCEGAVVTTTTTTLGGTPTTTVETPPTTVPVGTTTFNVTFRLTAASAAVGALQFHVDYANAPGEFLGSAGLVNCTTPIAGLFAPNDLEDQNQLNLGIISTAGFSAPINVSTCTFIATSADNPPTAGDFTVVIEDATDTSEEGNSITDSITVVTLVSPQ